MRSMAIRIKATIWHPSSSDTQKASTCGEEARAVSALERRELHLALRLPLDDQLVLAAQQHAQLREAPQRHADELAHGPPPGGRAKERLGVVNDEQGAPDRLEDVDEQLESLLERHHRGRLARAVTAAEAREQRAAEEASLEESGAHRTREPGARAHLRGQQVSASRRRQHGA